MQPLRYQINVTLDGCVDHTAFEGGPDVHRAAVEALAQADALLFGRVTYGLMESGWRDRVDMPEWARPFSQTINDAKKYVVSSKLERVDWNAELLRGDLVEAVKELKRAPGRGIYVGGVTLPLALAEHGLIDEYTFVMAPRLVGRGPTLFAGLSKHVDLKLVSTREFPSGPVALTYVPKT